MRSLRGVIFRSVNEQVLQAPQSDRSEDTGGIDGNGVLRVNLLSFEVLFQCKRYHGSVGRQHFETFGGRWLVEVTRA